MSTVKSLSVGDGDMFYINHNSKNFTLIDCCLGDDNKDRILAEVKALADANEIVRFISTHPDDDHIAGIVALDDKLQIVNFYCVKNEATKEDITDDFRRYCALRDHEKYAFYIFKGCTRKWMNQSDETRGASGLSVQWPDLDNQSFKDALQAAKDGESPNNISPVFTYSVENGVTMMWMGDLETEFMEAIADDISLPRAHILFAPHHGRDSGKVPQALLDAINPLIIVIGEAPSEHLNYYPGYNTITQNSAGDITFECDGKKVHIFVASEDYSVDFLDDEDRTGTDNYIGTLNI
jgi:beta-lactamase superfamily II metal-dependent hydrolase